MAAVAARCADGGQIGISIITSITIVTSQAVKARRAENRKKEGTFKAFVILKSQMGMQFVARVLIADWKIQMTMMTREVPLH